ncbi:MAG: DUF1697 domain-containing protein [Burkholderiales bacterium]|nr:DUF1697 domain-containing protein [Burkholderiales bacterium]
MPTFIALLRGVNVGKAKRVPMAEWKALMADLGYANIRTLLNSGNAVFEAKGKTAAATHAASIRKTLLDNLGVDVAVVVKSADELKRIAATNPWAKEALDASRLLVAFAPDAATLAALAPIAERVQGTDRFYLGADAAYLWCPGGLLESPAAEALLGKAGRAVTTRNGATLSKLLTMIEAD